MVAGSLSTFSLVGLVEAVAHVTVPASLANSVLQVELTGLDVELSTCTLPIIFNQQTFAPGFMFSVQVSINRLFIGFAPGFMFSFQVSINQYE